MNDIEKSARAELLKTVVLDQHAKIAARHEIRSLARDAENNRRPETGPQRDAIWKDAVRGRWQIRACHLARGFLRGTPYSAMEPRTGSPASAWSVWKVLVQVLPPEVAEAWTLARIQELLPKPATFQPVTATTATEAAQ